MSLLTIVQNAFLELGLGSTAPISIIGNTDATITQLLALANREGVEMARVPGQWCGWPEQRVQYTFSMVTAGSFTGITKLRAAASLPGFPARPESWRVTALLADRS